MWKIRSKESVQKLFTQYCTASVCLIISKSSPTNLILRTLIKVEKSKVTNKMLQWFCRFIAYPTKSLFASYVNALHKVAAIILCVKCLQLSANLLHCLPIHNSYRNNKLQQLLLSSSNHKVLLRKSLFDKRIFLCLNEFYRKENSYLESLHIILIKFRCMRSRHATRCMRSRHITRCMRSRHITRCKLSAWATVFVQPSLMKGSISNLTKWTPLY